MLLTEILEPFKRTNHKRELTLGPLLDDAVLRVVASWPNVCPSWSPQSSPPEDERDRLAWLWSGVDVDLDDLAAMIGLPTNETARAFEIAVLSCIIFPDGSVAPIAAAAAAANTKRRMKT